MKCVHLLENGKCSYVSHFSSTKDFAVSSDKHCIMKKESADCKYFEESPKHTTRGMYDDYANVYNEEAFEKIKKKKNFQ